MYIVRQTGRVEGIEPMYRPRAPVHTVASSWLDEEESNGELSQVRGLYAEGWKRGAPHLPLFKANGTPASRSEYGNSVAMGRPRIRTPWIPRPGLSYVGDRGTLWRCGSPLSHPKRTHQGCVKCPPCRWWLVGCWWPGLHHIFIRLGPILLVSSSTVRLSCPHLRGNSSSLGTNVTILDHLTPRIWPREFKTRLSYVGECGTVWSGLPYHTHAPMHPPRVC